VGEFVKVLIEAVVMVLAVSFISLGLHTRPLRIDIWPGLVVGITIPLVLAITFVTMYYWGVGLHKISLGSLIIALGLLVDDAIIAVEMMVRKLEEGYDKMRAATFAYEITAMPMLTGTLITAAGFLPIGMAKSVTGEYTFAIFAVTSAALVISWLVSVYFVPYLGAWLLHTRKPKWTGTAHEGELFDTPFYTASAALVNWCVQHRWITIGLTLATLSCWAWPAWARCSSSSSRIPAGPRSWWTCGCPRAATQQQSEALAALRGAHDEGARRVQEVTTWIGSGVPRFYLPLDQIFPQSNVSQSILLPKDLAARGTARALPTLLAEEFPEVRGRVKLLPNGPPVPYPVQFRVMGSDAGAGAPVGRPGQGILRANPNMRGVNDNWNESVKVLRLDRPGQGPRAGRDQPVHRPGSRAS
jgi:multidrug efflux pump